ncbi:serine/threonine protein kinase [Actinomadura rugatobispora]|uniref:Serine/threonine protein kinase n=1 Tax=Actinomadura rugatobispora TaxID=1994 RepID=A0ABW1A1M6_9ACTN|nr:hypothetical protein GCM10010200_011360 [Actinomadura rugatobispora]
MEPLGADDPRQVGPYVLSGRLGDDATGRLFRGTSPDGRAVVVTLVRPVDGDDAGFRQRFAKSAEAAGRVGGTRAVPVLDADPEADPPWLARAHVEGPSLLEAVGWDGPFPVDAVLALAADLAEGLAAIHDCGLAHGRLEPGNVILSPDGPRIVGFGVPGPPPAVPYVSPEHLGAAEPGHASDVFSLGSVLAFAATGAAPWGDEALYTILHREPELEGVAAELREVIVRCLEKDPRRRPKARDLLAAVPEPADDEPSAVFRVSWKRDLLHKTALTALAVMGFLPALVAVLMVLDVHVPGLLWVLAVPSAALLAAVLFGTVITEERLVVDRTGLTRMTGGDPQHYPWEEIEAVGFHGAYPRKPRWLSDEYLAVRPRSGTALAVDRSSRWSKADGRFNVIDIPILAGAPREEISRAVALYSEGRFEVRLPPAGSAGR